MKNLVESFTNVPSGGVDRHPGLVLAVCILGILGMLVVPLPPVVLDGLLAVNISLAVVILLVTVFAKDALSVSTFPSVLLVTTLFRLALNVSSTRMILARGDAGEVVKGFGQFVIQGDIIVGLVVFAVITIVQLMVIGKGAERVAEVAARFTLDAMPGKQMSIDAALRSGAITDDEAQIKRDELGRESQLYGAMDGAMKFVKGDAIAGLIITAINLVAGLFIGWMRFDMSVSAAAAKYAILTVGDGLVSQIPALLITLAAGLMTTRVAPSKRGDDLGRSLGTELFGQPKVLGLAAGLAFVMGVVPGMPVVPFWIVSALIGVSAMKRHAHMKLIATDTLSRRATFRAKLERSVEQAKAQKAMADHLAPTVVPICIEVDPLLSAALGLGDSDEQDSQLIADLLPQLRDALYLETGIRFPGVRVTANVRGLAERSFRLRIKDVPVHESQVRVDGLFALAPASRVARCGVRGDPTSHPIGDGEIAVVKESDRDVLEAAGIVVWSPAGFIALRIAGILRKNAGQFIGVQETSEMLERLEQVYPALVREVVPKLISLQQLVDVLRRLVDERICIRDLKSILEALAEHGSYENDGVVLTEKVRAALSLQIAHAYAGIGGDLPVVLLDPIVEETIGDAIHATRGGSYLALAPEVSRTIIDSVLHTLGPALEAGTRPTIITTAAIRRYFRKLIEHDLPDVPVLSFEELPPDLAISPLGQVAVRDS